MPQHSTAAGTGSQRSILEEREKESLRPRRSLHLMVNNARAQLSPWFSSVGRPLGGSGRRLPPDYRYHILPCLAPTNINHQGGKWVAALPKVRGAALSRGANVLTPTALPLSACMHSHSHTHQPLLGFSSLLFSHTLAHAVPHRAVSPAFVYPSDAPLSRRAHRRLHPLRSPSPFESRSPP